MEEDFKSIKEAIELGNKALDSVGKLGDFLSKVFGTLPEDVVGIVGGDWLRHTRIRIGAKLAQRTEEILRDRGRLEQTEPMSPSVALPLLHAAQDEAREELSEMWARMLANGMDKERCGSVRQSIIATVKNFDPIDAIILQKAFDLSGDGARSTDVKNLRSVLDVAYDEFQLSILNLSKLECIDHPRIRGESVENFKHFVFTYLGREVIRACKP